LASTFRTDSARFAIALTFADTCYIHFHKPMTVTAWLKARGVELGASLCTASILIAGLWIGVPFLRERIAETFLYSFCCVSAVLLRAMLDLSVRGTVRAARAVYAAAPHPVPSLGPSRA
jgi:hypothetical protein